MAVAAAGHAAGISLDLIGAPIPVTGFGVLTVVFCPGRRVLSGRRGLGRGTGVQGRRPRRAFVSATVVLKVLPLVPDAIADAGPATKALLMPTHLVAAAIVIPTIARPLAR